jgi:hypothetical protein
MEKRTKVLNPGEIIAESLTDYLKRHPEIETKLSKIKPEDELSLAHLKTKKGLVLKAGSIPYNIDFSQYKNLDLYITDDSHHYQQIAKNWFGQEIRFEKIELK